MTGAGGRLTFGPRRSARRPSLTPMIDVVFLLLVFFMLAARFWTDGALPMALAGPGAAAAWQGPPRLVTVTPEGPQLNGVPTAPQDLPSALARLMAEPGALVLVRAGQGASTGALVAVMDGLRQAGIARLAVVE